MEKSTANFEISIPLGQTTTKWLVKPKDTTDGVPVYYCMDTSNDKSTSCQIRKEPTGEWVQIWGNLSQHEIDKIGKAIEQYAESS